MKHTLLPFIDVATVMGVQQVVFLSIPRTRANGSAPHFKVEAHLEGSPLHWTFLRTGFFAQNFGDAYRRDIQEDDRLFLPSGHGRVAFVDVRDVALVAGESLANPAEHRRKTYHLTGPEPLTFDEAAALLTRILGRTIRYQTTNVAAYMSHLMHHRHHGLAQAAIISSIHLGIRFHQAEEVNPTLGRLIGRQPRSLETYLMDHAELWRLPPHRASVALKDGPRAVRRVGEGEHPSALRSR